MMKRNIIIKKLDTPELIEDACALLYKVHIEQANWKFSPDNPSRLRVETRNNRNLLVDKFTNSAIWFGALEDSQLIGCIRLTFADDNNKLEIEGYKNSNIIQHYLPTNKNHCIEITRCAVLPTKNRRDFRAHDLLLSIFEYCENSQYSICTTTSNEYLIAMLKKIHFPLKAERAFKYEEQDSAPVNFYFADYRKSEIKNVISNLKSHIDQKEAKTNSISIFSALEIVSSIIPTSLYWHDTAGAVLGLNSHCLKEIGRTRDEVIGKTPYDFYPREIAEHILKHNEQVIKTGEISWQEEQIKDVDTGEMKTYRSTKSPLYNNDGEVIGLIGSSVNITAEKEAERLKIENERQKTLLEKEEEFRKLANQVAHDIRSPLMSLSMIVKTCVEIPESKRIALREAATGIGDIANHLLDRYKQNEIDSVETEEQKAILVPTILLELLTSKKYQHKQLPIKFNCHFEDATQFIFIKTQQGAFKRMLSNLMNNAVDALDGKMGTVSLHLSANNEWVKITLQDTGKGMSPELIAKIMNKTAVTEGKKEGHGIGLTQVWDTLDKNQGEMNIVSQRRQGTTIILNFPRVKAPNWIAEQIVLNKNDLVIILDDDISIHRAWQTRFETILDKNSGISCKHFENGEDALDFINTLSTKDKAKVFLLSDYELLKQELNGLHIIAQSEIKRSILVTSHYADPITQEKAVNAGIKILPKQLASDVSIKIIEKSYEEEQEKLYAVIVDDNPSFVRALQFGGFGDRVTEAYRSPEELFKNIDKYSKDTRIFVDNNFVCSDLKGVDVVEKLHDMGYTRLYILSGEPYLKVPPYVTLIEKGTSDFERFLDM